ncbi:MAG: TatD family hydrolase [Methylococcales bacterium]
MLVDSHCHLDRIDLTPYDNRFENFVLEAKRNEIGHMLCIAIDLEAFPDMCTLVDSFDNISITVGVHPNVTEGHDPTIDELITLAKRNQAVGIGETGLDYFRSEGDLSWQQERFRTHIRAARECGKPLIIHSRDAKEDTLRLLKGEDAGEVGGVIHCFTEDWDMAKKAMDLNFHISFSGIVTFKNAATVQEAAKKLPEDRLLIETDSPYLAPVPFRGKPNYPIYVRHVAECVAGLRGHSLNHIRDITERNYFSLFG